MTSRPCHHSTRVPPRRFDGVAMIPGKRGHAANGGSDAGAGGTCGRPQCGMGGCAGLGQGHEEHRDRGLWVRPAAMFAETVEIDGRMAPRFRPLEE